MSKTAIRISLGITIVLLVTLIARFSPAADVETYGDLKVGGVIESTSGGFKFPDGSTWTTGSMDGLHFNMGFVVDDSNSNSGTLDYGAIKFGTGGTGEGIASQRTPGDGQNGLDFYTNFTSRLFIGNDGKVGIGSRTPQFQLTDANSTNTKWTRAQFGYRYPLYLMEYVPVVGFNAFWDSAVKYGSTHPAGLIAFDWSSPGGFSFMTAPSGTAGSNATMTNRLTITNQGKVGIGTASPAESLDVAGNIKASGNMTMGASALTAAGGKEGLTILRGFVAWNGSCMGGCNGFAVAKTAVGTYTITPTAGVFPVGDYPSYIVTAASAQRVASATLGSGHATVYIYRLSDNALDDAPFSILVVGGQP